MKSKLRAIVPLAATAFFLWLALRNADWGLVWTNLRRARPGYFAAALVVATLTIHVRALRWKTLLQPVAPDLPLHPRVASTAVGLAANNVLPARAGEFARALVCARLGRIPLPSVFGTLALERVLDGVAIIALLLGVVALEGFPGESEAVQRAEAGVRIVAGISAVLGVSLLALAVFPARFVALFEATIGRVLPRRLRRPVVDGLHAFLGGLAVLRSPVLLTISVIWAFGQWIFLASSYYFAMRAFGITEVTFAGAIFLQSLVALAVALPAAPGFAGVFHAAAVLGLGLYGVDESRAATFAIAFHLGGWITVTGLGLYYYSRLGLSWRELIGAEERVEEAVEEADPTARTHA